MKKNDILLFSLVILLSLLLVNLELLAIEYIDNKNDIEKIYIENDSLVPLCIEWDGHGQDYYWNDCERRDQFLKYVWSDEKYEIYNYTNIRLECSINYRESDQRLHITERFYNETLPRKEQTVHKEDRYINCSKLVYIIGVD